MVSAETFPVRVEVWRVDVSTEPAARWRESLLPDELARADRYLFEADRGRFTVTRGVLRKLLQRYRPDHEGPLEFVCNQWGKPALPCGEPRFNVSHSGDFALIAIAPGVEVGVDIEQVDIARRLDQLAETVFSRRELESFSRLQGDERVRFFFRTWSCKEAVIKAAGAGLSILVDRIQIEFGESSATVQAEPGALPAGPWSLQVLDAPSDYAAAVAARAAPIELAVYDWANSPAGPSS
jgi:4'-phosphopantetheinyl transferase